MTKLPSTLYFRESFILRLWRDPHAQENSLADSLCGEVKHVRSGKSIFLRSLDELPKVVRALMAQQEEKPVEKKG